jgi:DNA-binding transcriptional regulator YdaS (Cro superfamily)
MVLTIHTPGGVMQAMDLKTYMHQLESAELEDFAKAVSSSVGHLRNIAGGLRQAGEALAISIERESQGTVTCEEMRPDVDWAYVRGTAKQSTED